VVWYHKYHQKAFKIRSN